MEIESVMNASCWKEVILCPTLIQTMTFGNQYKKVLLTNALTEVKQRTNQSDNSCDKSNYNTMIDTFVDIK